MPRKKKVQKTAYELWLERKAEVEKQLQEVTRISQEAERLANIVAYKAQQLKESDPNSCKNCKHKHRCPFYDVQTGKREPGCLKTPAFVDENGRKGWLLAKSLFWKNQEKTHIYN